MLCSNATIHGTVKDSQTGKPLAEANVKLSWSILTQITSADSSGNYSFSAGYLYFGSFNLTVNLDGYKLYSIDNVKVDHNNDKNLDIKLTPVNLWRKDIQIGDILYDPDSHGGIGHITIYIGDDRTIEPQGDPFHSFDLTKNKVFRNSISSWDYPYRKNAYLLRVRTKVNIILILQTLIFVAVWSFGIL